MEKQFTSMTVKNIPKDIMKKFRIWCIEHDITLERGVIEAMNMIAEKVDYKVPDRQKSSSDKAE